MFWSSSAKSSENPGQGKVVAFLNQKGGVGKTTLAFNCAVALQRRGARVLCMVLDPQANLTLLLGNESEGVFRLLLNSVRELKALHTDETFDDVKNSYGDLDYLGASNDLSGFELSVAGIQSPRQLILKKFIEHNDLLKRYDYVVIDGPPTLGLLVVNIMCASHGIFVPFQPDKLSLSGLQNMDEAFSNIRDMGVGVVPKVLGYIPNLYDGRRKAAGEGLESISECLRGQRIFPPIPNKVQLARALAESKSVFDFQSKEYAPLHDTFMLLADSIEEAFRG